MMATYAIHLYTPATDEHGKRIVGADGTIGIVDTRTVRYLTWEQADHMMVKHIDAGGLADWECE